jgi:putative oxidoreductase
MDETIVARPPRTQTGLLGAVRRAEGWLAAIPSALPLLALRVALAVPFYKSGLTKWDGFLQLSGGAEYLFIDEFRLHVFGALYPYPYPLVAAHAAGIAEIVLPVFLVLGLGTRFAALGLLGMTAVIQLTVPEGWANFHLPWAAMALTLATFGGGGLALDRLVGLGLRKP